MRVVGGCSDCTVMAGVSEACQFAAIAVMTEKAEGGTTCFALEALLGCLVTKLHPWMTGRVLHA